MQDRVQYLKHFSLSKITVRKSYIDATTKIKFTQDDAYGDVMKNMQGYQKVQIKGK